MITLDELSLTGVVGKLVPLVDDFLAQVAQFLDLAAFLAGH